MKAARHGGGVLSAILERIAWRHNRLLYICNTISQLYICLLHFVSHPSVKLYSSGECHGRDGLEIKTPTTECVCLSVMNPLMIDHPRRGGAEGVDMACGREMSPGDAAPAPAGIVVHHHSGAAPGIVAQSLCTAWVPACGATSWTAGWLAHLGIHARQPQSHPPAELLVVRTPW